MIKIYESWGYEPLETPIVEPLELFEGEIGEDEKLFYTFKDPGGRDVALRYDQSVPASRVVGKYFQHGAEHHKDVYISVVEALNHAGAFWQTKVEIVALD